MPKRCPWCTGPRPRPVTHRTRWPRVVLVDELDGSTTEWFAPAVLLLCAFHARFARRYPGTRVYRFRRAS